jgi:hypothetical protein
MPCTPRNQGALDAIEVTSDRRTQLGVGSQRNAGAEVVAVIVLDVAVDDSGGESLAVLVEGSLGERTGDDRVGIRVLAGDGENRGPGLGVEEVQVARERANRSPELRIDVEHRSEQPWRLLRGLLLRRALAGEARDQGDNEQPAQRGT